ncbi:MAG: hypothetical protein KGS49_05585 [Planctomycetes bacterium]|nr:hypothetical protein [Planctomycetota bacterium]
MNEILSAIEKHLDRKLKVSELDYYQIIGLEPFCSDQAQIQAALDSARLKLQGSEPSNSLQVVSKLIKQAQTILLDASKKTAYDSQLAKLFESHRKQKELGKPITASATASIGILAKSASKKNSQAPLQDAPPNEDQLLPKGDPMQPFVIPSTDLPATYGPPNALGNLTVQKRREELSALFPSLLMMSHSTEVPKEQIPAWLIAADRKPTNPTSTVSNTASLSPANHQASIKPQDSPVDLVGQLRKRRQRRNLLGVGGMILAAISLLGFASYQFASNRSKVAKAEQEKKMLRQNGANQPPGPGTDQANNKLPELVIKPNADRKGAPNSQQSLPQLPQVNRDPSDSMPAEVKMPAEVDPDKTDPAMVTPAPMPEPPPKPEPAPKGESPEWKMAMTKARESLSKGDLKEFEPLMTGLLDKAVTKEGKEQTLRLDQAGQLYKIYVESFEEAKRKAKGASSLKVGTAEFSIVEVTPEKLIVRSQGQNKTYQWDKLPLGLAAALSDLGLSESAPVDVAARAIYFSLTPFYQEEAKANTLITKRIDGWFERSAGKESVRADIKQFLTDTYE